MADYLLNNDERQHVLWGEALTKSYFYIPVIYYSQRSAGGEEDWYSLRFDHREPPTSLITYASKVPAGQTLWQAIRHDLECDFAYPHNKSFTIEDAEPLDSAVTKDGRELTRLLVWVGVDVMFETVNISPVGTIPHWVYEGEYPYNLVGKYFEEKPKAASMPSRTAASSQPERNHSHHDAESITEGSYIQKVRDIAGSGNDAVKIVDEIASMRPRKIEGFSLNALFIMNVVDDLDFERADGIAAASEAYKISESRIASDILRRIESMLADIKEANWYRYIFSARFVYSRIKDGTYSSVLTSQQLDATTPEEARAQIEALKTEAPRTYRNHPDFTIENVQLSAELVDNHNNPVK